MLIFKLVCADRISAAKEEKDLESTLGEELVQLEIAQAEQEIMQNKHLHLAF